MERKEKENLLVRLDKAISDLKEIGETINSVVEKLESSVKRLRYQQTLQLEDVAEVKGLEECFLLAMVCPKVYDLRFRHGYEVKDQVKQ